MDATQFLQTIAEGVKSDPARTVRLATIDPAYSTGDPKVTFDGETAVSGKTYKYANYTPVASDRVVMLPVGNTSYIIIGAVGETGGSEVIPINPNLLINGTFRTNQRAYVSATDLALNAYGFDRWKATTANSRMTFTAAPQGQTVTIPSGDSWGQVIERADIDPGAHTVSHAGTAQARIYNVGDTPPAYADCPVTATLDGTTDVLVEFGPGTVDKAKVERGSVATPFVLEAIESELARCERFYETGWVTSWASTGGNIRFSQQFRTIKRASPTVTLGAPVYGTSLIPSSVVSTDARGFLANYRSSEANYSWTASAEL